MWGVDGERCAFFVCLGAGVEADGPRVEAGASDGQQFQCCVIAALSHLSTCRLALY